MNYKYFRFLIAVCIMHSISIKALEVNTAIKTAYKLNTFLGVVIPLVNYIRNHTILKKETEKVQLLDPVRIAQIHTYLRNAGINNPESIHLIKKDYWATALATPKVLYTRPRIAITQKQIAKDMGSVAHEVGHMKHYDAEREILLQVAVHYTINKLSEKYAEQTIESKTKDELLHSMLCTLGLMCANILLTRPLLRFYSRYKERQADKYAMSILNNPVVCQEEAKYFEKQATKNALLDKTKQQQSSKPLSIFSRIKSWYNNTLCSTHPDNKERAIFFAQHAQKLRS